MLQCKDKYWLNGYKNKTLYMLSARDLHQTYGNIQTDSEGLEKGVLCKWRPKESGTSKLISDKIGFRMKTIIRIKEGCYIMTKRSIQVEDITIINIYAPA